MKTKTKQTTRTGTELEKWTPHGGISVGRGKGGIGRKRDREEEEELVGIKQMGRDKVVQKQRTQRNYMYNPWTWTKWGNAGELEQQGGGGQRE